MPRPGLRGTRLEASSLERLGFTSHTRDDTCSMAHEGVASCCD
jgi:hypothetical protein